MGELDNLLKNNRDWAERVIRDDPDFFHRLENQQTPKYLWIGCSDSRVPANQILGLDPGEVFVHRNVANVLSHGDLNALSVIQFAVDVLKVEHILLVGHYGCGGVHAAMTGARVGLVALPVRRPRRGIVAAGIAEDSGFVIRPVIGIGNAVPTHPYPLVSSCRMPRRSLVTGSRHAP